MFYIYLRPHVSYLFSQSLLSGFTITFPILSQIQIQTDKNGPTPSWAPALLDRLGPSVHSGVRHVAFDCAQSRLGSLEVWKTR